MPETGNVSASFMTTNWFGSPKSEGVQETEREKLQKTNVFDYAASMQANATIN